MSSGPTEPGAADGLRESVLGFVDRHRYPRDLAGRYRYSLAAQATTLYSSTYAAMLRSLLGDLEALSEEDRRQWVAYLQEHQDEDGLYRDPVIFDQGWYKGDPLWCGRPHLSCHVITALSCLGATARKGLRFLEPFRDTDALIRWLAGRDWGGRVAWTGNEIMNVGTLLQYARDVHGDRRAGEAVAAMLEWLAANHVDPSSGVWGSLDLGDPLSRSHAVQAAYHWWPLFAHDGYPIPFVERAIDTVLATQNPRGGFGWGVHNPSQPYDSSACEDIDSIYPLVAMAGRTEYRRADILTALERAATWVLENRTTDGGFCFVRNRDFEYGHPELTEPAGVGAMFPTWFRTLSLAYIAIALKDHPLARLEWRFCRCPGYQFAAEGGLHARR